jgi:AcrR family transcriptional regulator
VARAFDDTERAAIRSQLMAAGMTRFVREGVRSARVEDICQDVGIAKGSFYAFFPSKEELFMQIADEREAGHRRDMLAFVRSAEGSVAERAGRFFDMLIDKIETDPVLAVVVAHGELAYLMRKLGPERMRQGQDSDRAFVGEVAREWPGGPLDPADLLGLMTIMLSLATIRQAMTSEQYRPTLALLRELFIDRLTGATS